MNYLALLTGKKTYAVVVVMIAYAIVYLGLQEQDWEAANKMILEGLALAGLRNGIK